MSYNIGDFVNIKGDEALYILEEFNGSSVIVRHVIPLSDEHPIGYPMRLLVKATQRASNLTPFQRGLLRSIKARSIPAWQYRHFAASSKRSVNCLIRKGYVELFDDTEPAPNGNEVNGQGVRVTWAGRRVDTSD